MTTHTTAASATNCYYGACYDYVSGYQYVSSSGAYATFALARPEVDPRDSSSHSLQELAVQSADGRQIVEVGWVVSKGINGDTLPHLFVYHWVNGQATCYNRCGFVSTSSAIKPGMRLPTYGTRTMQINHVSSRWEIRVNGTLIGYYPDSLWRGAYKRAGLIQTFGEVAALKSPTCVDMGNGRYASSTAASRIQGVKVLGTTTRTSLNLLVTRPTSYTSKVLSTTAFRLGGPGSGRC